VVEAPKVEEDYDKVFTVVQIAAEFPGGLPAWTKYLERNLNSDLPVENGAPPGKYTVVVSFIVSKTGDISDVSAENDPGYGNKAEADPCNHRKAQNGSLRYRTEGTLSTVTNKVLLSRYRKNKPGG
jgi:hypothetical protein